LLVAAATSSDDQLLTLLSIIGKENIMRYFASNICGRPTLRSIRQCAKMLALRYCDLSDASFRQIADSTIMPLDLKSLGFNDNIMVDNLLHLAKIRSTRYKQKHFFRGPARPNLVPAKKQSNAIDLHYEMEAEFQSVDYNSTRTFYSKREKKLLPSIYTTPLDEVSWQGSLDSWGPDVHEIFTAPSSDEGQEQWRKSWGHLVDKVFVDNRHTTRKGSAKFKTRQKSRVLLDWYHSWGDDLCSIFTALSSGEGCSQWLTSQHRLVHEIFTKQRRKTPPKTQAIVKPSFAPQPDTLGFVLSPRAFQKKFPNFGVQVAPPKVTESDRKGIGGRHRLGECERPCPCFPVRVHGPIGRTPYIYVDIEGPGGIIFNVQEKWIDIHAQKYFNSKCFSYTDPADPIFKRCIFKIDLRPFGFPLTVFSSAPLTETIRDFTGSPACNPFLPCTGVSDHPRGNCYSRRINSLPKVFALIGRDPVVKPIIHPDEFAFITNPATPRSQVHLLDITGAPEPLELVRRTPYFDTPVESWESAEAAPRNNIYGNLPERPIYVENVFEVYEPGLGGNKAAELLHELKEAARLNAIEDMAVASTHPVRDTGDICAIFLQNYPLAESIALLLSDVPFREDRDPDIYGYTQNWVEAPCICQTAPDQYCANCGQKNHFANQVPHMVAWLDKMSSSWVDCKWHGDAAVVDADEIVKCCLEAAKPSSRKAVEFRPESQTVGPVNVAAFSTEFQDENDAKSWMTMSTISLGSLHHDDEPGKSKTVSTILFSDDGEELSDIEDDDGLYSNPPPDDGSHQKIGGNDGNEEETKSWNTVSTIPLSDLTNSDNGDDTGISPNSSMNEDEQLKTKDSSDKAPNHFGHFTLKAPRLDESSYKPVQHFIVCNDGCDQITYFEEQDLIGFFGEGVRGSALGWIRSKEERLQYSSVLDLTRFGIAAVIYSTKRIDTVKFVTWNFDENVCHCPTCCSMWFQPTTGCVRGDDSGK
jgi:hypothetical protein